MAPVVLGLETSTHSGGAALLSGAGLAGSVCFNTKKLFSQRVLPSVEWLLEQTQHETKDLQVIGVSVGPGSFTGIRIGLSVAKALAYASGAKLVGVGTLEALAVRAAAGRDALVCPLLDARHGQVYGAVYEVTWTGGLPQVKIVREEWAGAVEDVATWVTEPMIFAGDALELAREKITPVVGDNFLTPPLNRTLPNPEDVALLSFARAQAGEFSDLMELEPRYVRLSYMQK